jgi:hypothetical protein
VEAQSAPTVTRSSVKAGKRYRLDISTMST